MLSKVEPPCRTCTIGRHYLWRKEAMSNDGSMGLDEIVFDASNLYREERITDLKAGVLRQLVPIKDDGTVDEERPVLLSGQTQVMSQAGPLPLDFALEATAIADAIKEFGVKKALEKLAEEMWEYERQQASRIVVPGRGPEGADKKNKIIL